MNHCRVAVSAAGLAGVLVCLSGCPSPNSYGTPRTVESGKVAHTVALEAIGVSYKNPVVAQNGTVTTESKTVFLPTLPTYQLRLGVADNVDLGFRVSNLSSLGADGKFNFLKSKSFDLALDPGFQWMNILGLNLFYFHLPLLAGINFSKSVSLVLSPGVLYALAAGTYNNTSSGNSASTGYAAGGFLGRMGVGLNIRFSKGFAMQPEFTVMHAFNDLASNVFSAGLGFNFGNLPNFDDVGTDDEEAAPAGTKPAPSAPAKAD
ncbi:MAG: outer membrane beta-barrel protein [Polyangiaceae bacterium]